MTVVARDFHILRDGSRLRLFFHSLAVSSDLCGTQLFGNQRVRLQNGRRIGKN